MRLLVWLAVGFLALAGFLAVRFVKAFGMLDSVLVVFLLVCAFGLVRLAKYASEGSHV